MDKFDYHNIIRRAFSDAYAVPVNVLESEFKAFNNEVVQLQAKQEGFGKQIRDINYTILFNNCKYDVLDGKLQIIEPETYNTSMAKRVLLEQESAKISEQQNDVQSRIQKNRYNFYQNESCLEAPRCSKCDLPCLQMELIETFCKASDFIKSLSYPLDTTTVSDHLYLNMHYTVTIGPRNKVNLKKIKIKESDKSHTTEQNADETYRHLPFLCAIKSNKEEDTLLQDTFDDFLKVCLTEYLFLFDENKAKHALGIALHGIIDKLYLENKELHTQEPTKDDEVRLSSNAIETIKAVYTVMVNGRLNITDYAAYKENKERIINKAVEEWHSCYKKYKE